MTTRTEARSLIAPPQTTEPRRGHTFLSADASPNFTPVGKFKIPQDQRVFEEFLVLLGEYLGRMHQHLSHEGQIMSGDGIQPQVIRGVHFAESVVDEFQSAGMGSTLTDAQWDDL